MARREWADKLADGQTCPQCAEQYGMGDNGDIVHVPSVVKLLHKEHARAVRIVKRYLNRSTRVYKAADAKASPDFNHYEVHFLIEQVCWEILDALQKGRA